MGSGRYGRHGRELREIIELILLANQETDIMAEDVREKAKGSSTIPV